MTFGKAFLHAHREALAFLLACPLIAMIPFLAELLQHYVEMNLGMYNGPEGAQAAEAAPARMQFGMVKVVALSIITYPVIRFMAGGRDRHAAGTLDRRAIGLFGVVLAFQLALAALDLFFLREYQTLSLSLFIAMLVLNPLLLRWIVAAPLGIWVSPARSAREMLPSWLWAFAFTFTAMLPLMVVHYALGIGAIFAPDVLKWPMLLVDSVVVAGLSVVMAVSSWIAAIRPGTLTSDQASAV